MTLWSYVSLLIMYLGLKLLEGETSHILSDQHLMIADEDNIDDVKVSVQYGLKHGDLVIPESRSYFTMSDLHEGSVRYRHDDTDTLTDNIIFKVSDGRNEVSVTFRRFKRVIFLTFT